MTTNATATRDLSITLRPLPSSPWITHDYGCGTSIVKFAVDGEDDLIVVAVRLEGLPMRFRQFDATTVFIEPMVPLQYGRLELLFTAPLMGPPAPRCAPQINRATLPLPITTYGLQATTGRLQRHTA
mgnify:CR=1 FL=1